MSTITLKAGDTITYAGEDNGGVLMFDDPATGMQRGWSFKPTFSHLAGRQPDEAELIAVDTDLPLAICQTLVDDGRCVLVPSEDAPVIEPEVEPAAAPKPAKTKSAAAAPTADQESVS